jgi:hypothetical protein
MLDFGIDLPYIESEENDQMNKTTKWDKRLQTARRFVFHADDAKAAQADRIIATIKGRMGLIELPPRKGRYENTQTEAYTWKLINQFMRTPKHSA